MTVKVSHTEKDIFGEADTRHLSQEIFQFIIEEVLMLCSQKLTIVT
jgi:hypothetical protein